MLPLLQFLFPALFLKLLNKIEIEDAAGLFFARHWGMMAFVVGGCSSTPPVILKRDCPSSAPR